jgi:ATP-dependent HslUV protease ATP-binding subunit HslU
MLERLLEKVSFDASDIGGSALTVDAGYVDTQLKEVAGDEDLSRYIL